MTSIRFDRLGHDRQQRELAIDACEVGFAPGQEPLAWFDTIPGGPKAPGVEVRNRRTGNVVRFVLRRRDTDPDGDVRAWVFEPCPRSVAQFPNLVGYTLKIYND